MLSAPELARIFISILDDLERAHSQGSIHGDIKPRKIVQVADGVWRLIDYGASRVGTARYIAPERAEKKAFDARADLYSLGVVLYEAATGQPPFTAEIGAELIQAHISQNPPPPSSIKPDLSRELEQVILRALAKNPEQRFQNAKEFRAALVPFIPKEPEKKPLVQAAPAAPEPVVVGKPVTPKPEPRRVMASARPVTPRPAAAVVPPVAVKRRANPLVWILPLVLVMGVAVFFFFSRTGGNQVPSVVGLTREDATAVLERTGFKLELGEDKHDTIGFGRVSEQIPAPGVWLKKGQVVRVRLSTGLVLLPDVVGMTREEAERRLRTVGLDSTLIIREYNDQVQTGTVIGTEPKSGTKLKPRTLVRLRVVAGRATCPECRARREPGAQFCTSCGYRFVD